MTTNEPGDVPPPPTAPLPPSTEPAPDAATPPPTAPSAPVFGAPAAPAPDADLAPAAPYGATPTTPLPPAAAAAPSAPSSPVNPFAPPGPGAGTPAAAPYGAPAIPTAPGAAPAYGPPPTPGAPPAAPYGAHPGAGAPHGAPLPYLTPGTGQPGGFPPAGPQPAGKGMAITALVLAGVALLLSWVPLVNFLAGALAVAGLVVGVVALVKGRPGRGLAIGGVILAVVSVGMVIASQAVYARIFGEFVEQVEQSTVDPYDEWPADPSPDPFAEGDDPSTEAPEAPEAPLVAGFDQAFTYDDGLTVTVGSPQPFTPSGTAVTGPAGEHLRMTVTIQNGTSADFDPMMFLASGTSAGAEAEQIFDFENDLDTPPPGAVPPGGSVSFDVAYTVPDRATFALEVNPSFLTYKPFVVSAG